MASLAEPPQELRLCPHLFSHGSARSWRPASLLLVTTGLKPLVLRVPHFLVGVFVALGARRSLRRFPLSIVVRVGRGASGRREAQELSEMAVARPRFPPEAQVEVESMVGSLALGQLLHLLEKALVRCFHSAHDSLSPATAELRAGGGNLTWSGTGR
eukprot:scaffold2733_cov255-Pinguiococcus_pyrenoidosus.AAC.1